MKEWLGHIELEYGIEILFACEAGSRAWGYASVHSDQDIRFIYKHRDTRMYFSLDSPLDVITMNSPYDAQGWDIKKTFHLLRKSNPNLFEWSNSPIVYQNNGDFQTKLQHIAEKGYSPFSLAMHYMNLAKRILKGIDQNRFTKVEQKQLLYCLRSLLIMKELVHARTISGRLIPSETNVRNVETGIEEQVFVTLMDAKKKDELILAEDRKIAYEVIDQLIYDFTGEVEDLEKGMDLTVPLNQWLWDILGLWRE